MTGRPLAIAALVLAASTAAAESLDLTACVRRALVQNPAVEDAADASVSAAIARQVPAAAYHTKVVPALAGGFQGSNRTNQRYHLLISRKLLPFGTEVTVGGGTSVHSAVPEVAIPYVTETRVGLAQPLLAGRTPLENREAIDDAERRYASATNALTAAREDVVLSVVRAYYDVVRARALEDVAAASLDRVTLLSEVARAKLAIGSVSKMDLFRTDLHAARLRNALVEQRSRRETALEALKAMLGLDPALAVEVEGGEAVLSGDPAVARIFESTLDPEPLIDRALERRVEVREAKADVADAERKVLLSHRKIWPSLDLVASYARQGLGDTFEDSSRLERSEWLVGLRSTTPLDRTEEQVAAAQAELALRSRERRYQTTRERIAREVRSAARGVARARAESILADEIAEQTEKQAELARFRYDKGVTDNFDLVQAETELAEARSARALSRIDEIVAHAALRRATASLLEAFDGGLPPPAVP